MENEKNNKTVLEESLLDLKAIEEMVTANSEGSIKNLLSEAVRKELNNKISEATIEDDEKSDENGDEAKGPEDTKSDGDEKEDGEDLGVDIEDGNGEDVNIGMEGGEEAHPEDEKGEDLNMDDFKTGEDEYDLTNKSTEEIIKVFKKLDDTDSIIVKKLDDGKIDINNHETGDELIIDLNGDSDVDIVDTETPEEEVNMEVDPIEDEHPVDEDITVELDGENDSVQEKNMTQSIGTNRRAGRMTQTRKEYAPGKSTNRDGAKLIAAESKKIATEYNSKLKKIEEAYATKLNEINEEVSGYKKTLLMFRDKLKEQAVLNNNLAKYTKIVTENTTTKEEKLAILKRFATEASTIEAGNTLFESVNEELSKKINPIVNIDKQFNAVAPKKQVNEQVIYETPEINEMVSLTDRMNRLHQ
jgi:hypothetical protein